MASVVHDLGVEILSACPFLIHVLTSLLGFPDAPVGARGVFTYPAEIPIMGTALRADHVIVLCDERRPLPAIPRQGAIRAYVLEVQREQDSDRMITWGVYLAAVMYALGITDVMMLVMTFNRRTAAFADRPVKFSSGHFTPLVLRQENVPRILSSEEAQRSPGVALVSAAVHLPGLREAIEAGGSPEQMVQWVLQCIGHMGAVRQALVELGLADQDKMDRLYQLYFRVLAPIVREALESEMMEPIPVDDEATEAFVARMKFLREAGVDIDAAFKRAADKAQRAVDEARRAADEAKRADDEAKRADDEFKRRLTAETLLKEVLRIADTFPPQFAAKLRAAISEGARG